MRFFKRRRKPYALINHYEHYSTMFWLNIATGGGLALADLILDNLKHHDKKVAANELARRAEIDKQHEENVIATLRAYRQSKQKENQ